MKQEHSIAGLARHLARAAVAAAIVVTVACGAEGGREDYAEDGDTGAAAPAVEGGGYDQSTAEMIGPDSSPGTQGRTGVPGAAGDTMGQRGRAAGAPPAGTPNPPPR